MRVSVICNEKLFDEARSLGANVLKTIEILRERASGIVQNDIVIDSSEVTEFLEDLNSLQTTLDRNYASTKASIAQFRCDVISHIKKCNSKGEER